MDERTGEAFELGEQLTVIGIKLQAGDAAPDFVLDFLDTDGAIKPVSLADSHGAQRLLNVINSIDTPVCQVETRSWQQRLPVDSGVRVMTISMDLPFALDRWRETEGAGHQLLSAHRSETFGRDYGVLLKEWRLLQRAVFVIDGAGRIVHAEYVPDQMAEPDYDAAIAALG
ncbi:thiol peroxidase [Allorhizocola rhizosphaerae]|uniref:thiol peroxidase n=1 Tax=Allorhizocola rhizosphaerae TaxID=1872709 RepID=UPI000E3E72A4|nr:thiol peroxidase [Allorhizocola rhizosphaerae]